jgi:formate-dependent nitrite reductase membrane component NrfD
MKHIEWGLLVVNYLFFGGLSAGILFLSALATLFDSDTDGRYVRLARRGAFLAPWPVMLGTFLLIFDLGKWYRFYLLMMHFRWTSPMSIGSWLLLIFNVLSLLFLWSWLTAEERNRIFGVLPVTLRRFNRDLAARRRLFALLALPCSVGVGIYTGVLLGAVQSRPFWNTNLVAQLFLVSAVSTGCAALMLALILWKDSTREEMQLLYGLDILFLTLEFFIVLPYLIHGEFSIQPVQDALKLVLGGPFTLLFWVAFVGMGLLVPLFIELYEMSPLMLGRSPLHFSGKTSIVTSALVLAGGFLLRYIFVYAGQMSRFD